MSKIIKNTKPQIETMQVMPYKGINIIIRMINKEIFEYLFTFNNEIYSSYVKITPAKGKTKLNADEIKQSCSLIFTGALATIDTLLGTKLEATEKEKAEEFLRNGGNVVLDEVIKN